MMIGYIAAMTGAVFVSAKDLVSKKLASRTSGTISAFASFAFAIPYYLVLLAVLFLMGIEDFAYSPKFLTFVLLRSVTDVGAEWFKMSALSLGEISLVGQFLALSPIFLAFTSPLITGDVMTPQVALALVMVTMSSLLLAVKPKGQVNSANDKKAIRLAVCSAFFFSLNSALDRLAVQEASASMSAFLMTLLSGLILFPIVLIRHRNDWMSQISVERKGLFLRGFFEVIFMVAKMIALQFLQAPIVIVIQRFSLLLTIIGGRLLYNERDFRKRMLVGVLVIISGFLVLL